MTLEIDLQGQQCKGAVDGITLGFINTSVGISPASGSAMGLDPTKRLWTAALVTRGSKRRESSANRTNQMSLNSRGIACIDF
jgi:hypothetical protein